MRVCTVAEDSSSNEGQFPEAYIDEEWVKNEFFKKRLELPEMHLPGRGHTNYLEHDSEELGEAFTRWRHEVQGNKARATTKKVREH